MVRLQWEGNGLGMVASDGESSKTQVTIPAQSTAPGRVALNIRYLSEYCSGKEGSITISAGITETSPVMFTYHGVMDCVVMPMFVKW